MPIEIEPANVLPTQSDIDAFEQPAGIQLPPAYCAFLLQYGDGRPVDSQYPGDRRGISVERFFTVLPGRNSIARHMEMLDDRIMKTSIPIADCPCGDKILMRPKSGSIWFWDHELELIGRSEAGDKLHTRLAKNIDEFLDRLIDCRGEPLRELKAYNVWIDADFAAEHNLKIPPGATVGRRPKNRLNDCICKENAMDQDQAVPHAPDALLIDVENSSASDLFMAVIPALQLGNINDAGFLFYIAKFRGQLEMDSFPPDDQEMDSPAVAFSALSEQMGHPINQAVCSDPETLKTILDRVACWHPKIDDGFQPDWKYTHRADPEEACAKNEAAVAAFLKGMGGLCTLLNDPEYFRAYQTVLRYNTAAVPCPTQHEFEGAKTFMAEEEQRRNIHGIFYRPEK